MTAPLAMRDFSRATLAALAARGVVLVGAQMAQGSLRYGNPPMETHYILNDNGTSRIRSFDEVLEMAR